MVEEVGHLGAELHAYAFLDLGRLQKGGGDHFRADARNGTDAGVAEAANVVHGRGEGSRVEPSGAGPYRELRRDTRDAVRPAGTDDLSETGARGIGAGYGRREERTGLPDDHAAQLPSGDDAINERIRVRQVGAVSAKGQLPKACGQESVAAGEGDVAVVDARILDVGLDAAVLAHECSRVIPLCVGKISGEGVTALKLDTPAEVTVYRDSHRVVVAEATIFHRPDLLKDRKGLVLQRRRIADRIRCGRIQVFCQGEVRTGAARVVDRERCAVPELALARQVPLVDRGILEVERKGLVEVLRSGDTVVCGKWMRELERRLAVDDGLVVDALIDAVDCKARR